MKHESWRSLLRDVAPWVWFELRALAYATFVEPHYWLAFGGALRALPALVRKRQKIASRRRVRPEAMQQWYEQPTRRLAEPLSTRTSQEAVGACRGRIAEHT